MAITPEAETLGQKLQSHLYASPESSATVVMATPESIIRFLDGQTASLTERRQAVSYVIESENDWAAVEAFDESITQETSDFHTEVLLALYDVYAILDPRTGSTGEN